MVQFSFKLYLIHLPDRNNDKRKSLEHECFQTILMVAEVGLEPHDLRVMSPTSYQLLHSAISYCCTVYRLNHTRYCGARDRTWTGTGITPTDFKSVASADSATRARYPFRCFAIVALRSSHVKQRIQLDENHKMIENRSNYLSVTFNFWLFLCIICK